MKKNIPLVLIFFVVFIDLLGFGLLIPILPTFAVKILELDESTIGLLIAVYSLTQFIFNPVLGSISDSIGRKKVIVVTLLLNAIGYFLFTISDSFLLLLISRIVCGIGGSSIGVAQAYIADITSTDERAKGMGLIGVAFGLGFVFGPFLGGILAQVNYNVVGYGSMAFSLLSALFSISLLPESLKSYKHFNLSKIKLFNFSSFRLLFDSPVIGIIVVLYFVLTFSIANIYGTLPLLGVKLYNLSDFENGLIFGLMGIVGVLIQGGFIGNLTTKFGELKLMQFGAFFLMIGLGLLPFGIDILTLIIILVILAIGSGILQPVLLSLVSKVTPQDKQGIVLGINQSVASFARVLGPLWGGFSFEFLGYHAPFLTGAFSVFLLWIFMMKHLKKFLLIKNELSKTNGFMKHDNR